MREIIRKIEKICITITLICLVIYFIVMGYFPDFAASDLFNDYFMMGLGFCVLATIWVCVSGEVLIFIINML